MTGPRPEGAPGDLVTCPECEGRWWGDTCPTCGSWGVIHIGEYGEAQAALEGRVRDLSRDFGRLEPLRPAPER